MSRYGLSGFDGSEPDLAIGSVTGVRWWDYARGTLTGVHGVWDMGENVARCGYCIASAHMVPNEDCGCGFWAYWAMAAAPNPHGFKLPVLGVIDGYGKTLIGEKGFRCARARIVALHLPGSPQGIADAYIQAGAPDCLRGRGEAAVATWEALTGRRTRQPPPEYVTVARLAAVEMALEERYGVPIYATAAYLLGQHPPTPDYLPRQDRPALPRVPRLTSAEALALLNAKAQPSSDE